MEPSWNICRNANFARVQPELIRKGAIMGIKVKKCMNTGDIKVNRKMRGMINRKTKKNIKHAPGNCKRGRFCALIHFSYDNSCFSSQGGQVFTLCYVCLLRTSQAIWFCDNIFLALD